MILAFTPSLDETVPYHMYLRDTFYRSRWTLLCQWLVMGNLLSHIYKGALLTSLITIRYTETIDTMTQMEESGLPLYCLGKTHNCIHSNGDPVMNNNKMKNRRFDIPYPGWVDDKYLNEYERKFLRHFQCLNICQSIPGLIVAKPCF